MKKFFLMVGMLSYSSLIAMHELDQPKPMGIDSTGEAKSGEPSAYETFLNKRRQYEPDPADQKTALLDEENGNRYETLKTIINTVQEADIDGLNKALTGLEWRWARGSIDAIVQKYSARLKHDFGEKYKHLLWGQWPFSPVWLALELVIAGKGKEDSALYQKRLLILEKLALGTPKYHQKDQHAEEEALELREEMPPSCIAFVCIWPLFFAACSAVRGWPIHRAAQSDNVDALKIFIKIHGLNPIDIGTKDEGWTPIKYAFGSSAKNCAAHLIDEGAALKGRGCEFCQDLRCLACCLSDKKTRELLTNGPNYTPICCDWCV